MQAGELGARTIIIGSVILPIVVFTAVLTPGEVPLYRDNPFG
jgi:hypothetical protein